MDDSIGSFPLMEVYIAGGKNLVPTICFHRLLYFIMEKENKSLKRKLNIRK